MIFERDLIKLCVDYDVPLDDWIRDDKVNQFQMLAKTMFDEGTLIYDTNRQCGLRVIERDKVKEFDVDDFRKYWLKSYSGKTGYAGDKPMITTLLFDFMSGTGHGFETVCKAGKFYVDDLKAKGEIEYMMKCANFIIDNKGVSTLQAVIDDMNSGSQKDEGGMYELV